MRGKREYGVAWIPAFAGMTILLSVLPLLEANPPKTCRQAMEESRIEQLSRLFRLEQDFIETAWHYRKYQETVYTPLWEASKKKTDRFSEEARREGEMAFERYRHLADASQEKARLAMKRMQRTLSRIETDLAQNNACGISSGASQTISDFQNCMEIFRTETIARLTDLRGLLVDFFKDQESFGEMVESHLGDNPSDHDTFADRFRDYLFPANSKATSVFLRITRDLQERFERKWPAQTCCAACHADQSAGQDPVLSQIKLDAQGEKGVAGQMVNNARILDAFGKYEKEEEGIRRNKTE